MKRASGFSLVEIIIAMGILLFVTLAANALQADIFRITKTTQTSFGIQDEVRRALRLVSAEVRTTSPSSLGAYPVVTVSPTTFTFYADTNGNGIKERVRYFVNGSALQRGVITPTGNPLVYNAANEKVTTLVHSLYNGATPVFSYYNTNYDGMTAPLTDPVDLLVVRLVKITIVTDPNPIVPPIQRTMTTQVSLRNLKDNL